jgi:hypothetical protein
MHITRTVVFSFWVISFLSFWLATVLAIVTYRARARVRREGALPPWKTCRRWLSISS